MTATHTLILGATKGIGRAVAKTLVEEGHSVSVIGRRLPPDANAAPALQKYWAVDLTNGKRRVRALDAIIRERGKLTHMIFVQRYRGDGDAWAGEIETSLTATKETIEKLAAAFDGKPENSIVMVGSIASQLIAEEQPVGYHVAKAGLAQMARYYAVTLGPRGIRVNCVSPGVVVKDESREFYLRQKKLRDLYKKIIPIGRMSTAEEIAQLVAFLCSPKAAAITGQNIVADGGLSLQWQESLTRRVTLKKLSITRNPQGK